MNAVQWVSLARAFVILFGGVAVGLGWAKQSDIDALSDPTVLAPIVGGVGAIIAIIYGWRARRTSAITDAAVKLDAAGVAAKAASADPQSVVAAAASVPSVQTIVAAPNMAAAIPSEKVVARTP